MWEESPEKKKEKKEKGQLWRWMGTWEGLVSLHISVECLWVSAYVCVCVYVRVRRSVCDCICKYTERVCLKPKMRMLSDKHCSVNVRIPLSDAVTISLPWESELDIRKSRCLDGHSGDSARARDEGRIEVRREWWKGSLERRWEREREGRSCCWCIAGHGLRCHGSPSAVCVSSAPLCAFDSPGPGREIE